MDKRSVPYTISLAEFTKLLTPKNIHELELTGEALEYMTEQLLIMTRLVLSEVSGVLPVTTQLCCMFQHARPSRE